MQLFSALREGDLSKRSMRAQCRYSLQVEHVIFQNKPVNLTLDRFRSKSIGARIGIIARSPRAGSVGLESSGNRGAIGSVNRSRRVFTRAVTSLDFQTRHQLACVFIIQLLQDIVRKVQSINPVAPLHSPVIEVLVHGLQTTEVDFVS
jgi:hypothetical protein